MNSLIARVERLALGLTTALAIVAGLVPVGGLRAVGGVVGGAVLGAVSSWAIKHGVTGIADAILRQSRTEQPTNVGSGPVPARRRAPRGFVMFVVRYALLGLLAYVMIARLRLPPIWLLSGASVMAFAASIALLRGVHRT